MPRGPSSKPASASKSAAAHRGGTSRLTGGVAQPVHQRSIVQHGLLNGGRAGYHQSVDGGWVQLRQSHRVDAQAFGGWHQPARQAGVVQHITLQTALGHGLGRGPEHRLRAGQVEQAHVRVGQEHQSAGLAKRGECGHALVSCSIWLKVQKFAPRPPSIARVVQVCLSWWRSPVKGLGPVLPCPASQFKQSRSVWSG